MERCERRGNSTFFSQTKSVKRKSWTCVRQLADSVFFRVCHSITFLIFTSSKYTLSLHPFIYLSNHVTTTLRRKRESAQARLSARVSPVFAELLVFHPVDTVAKRLMSNKVSGLSMAQVVFKDKATANLSTKFRLSFPRSWLRSGLQSSSANLQVWCQRTSHDYSPLITRSSSNRCLVNVRANPSCRLRQAR